MRRKASNLPGFSLPAIEEQFTNNRRPFARSEGMHLFSVRSVDRHIVSMIAVSAVIAGSHTAARAQTALPTIEVRAPTPRVATRAPAPRQAPPRRAAPPARRRRRVVANRAPPSRPVRHRFFRPASRSAAAPARSSAISRAGPRRRPKPCAASRHSAGDHHSHKAAARGSQQPDPRAGAAICARRDVAQGEGQRDQLTIRGQPTTADFYSDGVRDDAEYYRDLYNIQAWRC